MTTLVCHNCGHDMDYDVLPKEFVCSVCGAVNVVEKVGVCPEQLR